MKKKSLKNLRLRKHSVSNLALLHRKTGGATDTYTDVPGSANPNDITFDNECIFANMSMDIAECPTLLNNDCGTVRAKPPTEYQSCNDIAINTNNNPAQYGPG